MIHYAFVSLLNWSDIPAEQLNPSLVRQAIHTGQMTIARLQLKKGAMVPSHSHHNEQVSMVESGALKFILPDREVIVRAGQVLELKPHLPHGVEVLEDSVVVDLFTPRREDWITGDDAYLRG
jgi:quercetin dioxygenase-like cupin family protein